MTFHTALHSTILGLAAAAMTACLAPTGDEAVAETTSDLSVASWSAPAFTMEAYRTAQLTTLNGTTYMVSSGRCGAWSCGGDGEASLLYWSKLTATGRTSGVQIPNQMSADKVSLAAFNGFVYMVHSGNATPSQVWISRFDPATEQWSANYQLPYTSLSGPPAIAAFNGKLYLIGTTPGTFHMWMASMTSGEVFSAMTPLTGHDSASRPYAAVFGGRLTFVHRHGQTGNLVLGTTDGASWTAPQFIPAAGGAAITGLEAAVATDAGYLHLIHRRPGATDVWWTYFDGCTWATEVTLNALQSSYDPSLTQGGPGLVMTTAADSTWNGIIETRRVSLSKYTHPVTRFPPTCGVILE